MATPSVIFFASQFLNFDAFNENFDSIETSIISYEESLYEGFQVDGEIGSTGSGDGEAGDGTDRIIVLVG